MTKKNTFGSLVIIEACEELEHIAGYLERYGVHDLTAHDWDELEKLINRCQNEDADLSIRAKNIMEKRPNNDT